MEWKIKNTSSEFSKELLEKFPSLILKIMSGRGINDPDEIEGFFDFNYEQDIADPFSLSGMEKAVARIETALGKKEKVAIFGDYDADGVTATALLYEILREIGFKDVGYYIPDRQLEGYGMNEKAIDYLNEQGVNLIITVDCGITNIDEVKKAKELGIDVIVTDHHHVPKELPDALAIINPHMGPSGAVFGDLAGVGVAFKLADAVIRKIKPEFIDQLKWSLDLVAIGTIADCVPLRGENRVLVKYGLIVLSKTRKIGLEELFKVGRIDISDTQIPDTQKVAFQIAPRINAAGRMDHASVSYKLLIERDRVKARDMALEVESKNQERQKVTAQIVKEVKVIAENSWREKKIIIAENQHWPVGILGLIAGKITDEYQKPTVVMRREEKEFIGSLRSIPEVDLMKVLEGCSECLLRFGGHAQAAGLRIAQDKIEQFYTSFEKLAVLEMADKKISKAIDIDCEISDSDLNWETIGLMEKMEPFGRGNEEPVFLGKNFLVMDAKICGNGSKHLKLALKSSKSPKIFDSIGFGLGDKFPELKNGDNIDIVFNLRADEWNGNKKMQFRIIDIKVTSNQ